MDTATNLYIESYRSTDGHSATLSHKTKISSSETKVKELWMKTLKVGIVWKRRAMNTEHVLLLHKTNTIEKKKSIKV